ncbi:MAG TPA: hypothetical protein VKI99_08875 [Candidatus Dormibacteraeota bacterium]|nr:hypothetical protein [Candidatus Dormibacteraeota bacterium]
MPLASWPKQRSLVGELSTAAAAAVREHRSMNEVARLAVLSRIEDAERRERVLALTD